MKKLLCLLLIALMMFGCSKSENKIEGVYTDNFQTMTFASDGTFSLIMGSTKTTGSYTTDDKNVNIIIGQSVVMYNYSFSNDQLVLVENGKSNGSVLTKIDKASKTVKELKQNGNDLIGNIYETNNELSSESYTFVSSNSLIYTDLFGNISNLNYSTKDNIISVEGCDNYQFEVTEDTLVLYKDPSLNYAEGRIYSLVGKVDTENNSDTNNEAIAVNSENLIKYYLSNGEIVEASGSGAGYYYMESGEIGTLTPNGEFANIYQSAGLFDSIGTVEKGCELAYYDVSETTNGKWYNISKNGNSWMNGSEVNIIR